MDKELERLINSVIEKAIDDSEASDKLVDALVSEYFQNTSEAKQQNLGDVLDALKVSAEKGNSRARLWFSFFVYKNDDLPAELKKLAISFGSQCGYLTGIFYAAEILLDDVFRPRDYFYNPRGGILGQIMLNEPDYALSEAAGRYQFIVDNFEPDEDGQYPDWVLYAAVEAARLNLNKRGFGPGLPIGDEEKALSDLDFVMENGKGEQFARAAATKGAYLLEKSRDVEAADCFIAAIENDPDSVSEFCREHFHDREAYDRVLAACEAAKDNMSPDGLEGLETFPYCWHNWH